MRKDGAGNRNALCPRLFGFSKTNKATSRVTIGRCRGSRGLSRVPAVLAQAAAYERPRESSCSSRGRLGRVESVDGVAVHRIVSGPVVRCSMGLKIKIFSACNTSCDEVVCSGTSRFPTKKLEPGSPLGLDSRPFVTRPQTKIGGIKKKTGRSRG